MSACLTAAHVSGPLGQALAVIDGETWLYELGEDRRQPTANDIRFFFDYGLEVRPLTPVETASRGVEDLLAILASETGRFRALRGMLIGMDPELNGTLRLRGMRQSDALLDDGSIADFVETRFLRPVEGQAWLVGPALSLARNAGLRRVERLYAVVRGPWLIQLENEIHDWVARHHGTSLAGAVAVQRAYDTGLIAAMATGIQDGNLSAFESLQFRSNAKDWDWYLVAHLMRFAVPRQTNPTTSRPKIDLEYTLSITASVPEGQKRTSGTVKSFNPQKGFGFIQPDDGTEDVFVHITTVARGGMSLTEGQKVTFDLEHGKQGKVSAIDIKVI